MEIKIIMELNPNTLELHMLNMPFEEMIKGFRKIKRVSSYHDPLSNEPNWFKYGSLSGVNIIIANSELPLQSKDIFEFMIQNNGFAMSRDNLFALSMVYEETIMRHVSSTKKEISIAATAHTNLLPTHQNGPKICPLMVIGEDGGFEYDWSWIDDGRMEIKTFAFFKKNFKYGFIRKLFKKGPGIVRDFFYFLLKEKGKSVLC